MRGAERRLYDALAALRHQAEQGRERQGRTASQRDVESAAARLSPAVGLGNARISDWVPPQDAVDSGAKRPVVPRKFDPLWTLVRVWSGWAGIRPHEGYWADLHEAARSSRRPGGVPPPGVPFTLPPDVSVFVGRGDQLARVREAVDPGGADHGCHGVVIDGMAGVGKSSLAVRVAREAVAEGWFPGGALFVDLQGYDDKHSLTADRAAAELLRQAEHAEGATAPARLDAYRRMLRVAPGPMLIVLDNASGPEQVSPLRPSGRGHRIVVTSRYKLPSLVGLRKVGLGVMTPVESADLLGRQLRSADPRDDRMERDPEEAARLAGLCGFLPLALRIAAALLELDPRRPLGRLADELTAEHSRLALLHPGDTNEAPVRAAFALSYRHLGLGDPERGEILRKLFRLLPLGPFPDPSTSGAAAQLGLPVERTRPLLRELARAHLIEPGRRDDLWDLHDLIRLFAQELAVGGIPASARDEAFKRAGSADMYRVNRDHGLTVKWAGRIVARFNGWGDALAWPDAEQSRRLVHADELAERTGHADAFAYLEAGIAAFGARHLPGESLAEVFAALDAAMRALDTTITYADSVPVDWEQREQETAYDGLTSSQATDELVLRSVSCTLADATNTIAAGRYDEAVEVLAEAARALRRREISPFYEAVVLEWVGDVRALQGRVSQTRKVWRRALELLTEAGSTLEADRLRVKLRRLPPPRTVKKHR